MYSVFVFASLLSSLAHLGFAFNANGYDFVLNSNPHAARALYVPPEWNPMAYIVATQFTFCFHVFLNRYDDMYLDCLFSYACPQETNEILVELLPSKQSIQVHIKDNPRTFNALPPFEQWTHMCLSWNSIGGVFKIYFDGKMVVQESGYESDLTLHTKGDYLNLGQNQDGLYSKFEAEDGFRGKMTHFNSWDKELSLDDVIKAQKCALEGNIVAWSKSNRVLSGHADLEPSTAPCGAKFKGVEEGNLLDKAKKCEHSVTSELDLFKSKHRDVIGTMKYPIAIPAQTSLSFCFWAYLTDEPWRYRMLHYFSPGDYELYLLISSLNDEMELYIAEYTALKAKNLHLSNATWHHFCVTWSQVEGDVRLFVNGEIKGYNTGIRKGKATSAGYIELTELREGNFDAAEPMKGFKSKITDVNWWDRVLTRAEVAKVFECRSALPGNILNAMNTIYKPCAEQIPWELRSGIDSPDDATEELKQISGKVKNPLPKTSEFTACFYIEMAKAMYQLKIFVRDSSGKAAGSPTVFMEIRRKKFWMYINGNLKETPLINENDYENFCVTWSGGNGEIKYYKEGDLVASEANFSAQSTIPSGHLTLSQILNHPVTDEELNTTFKFPLRISDFSWWNRVLSPVEILKIYYCGNSFADGAIVRGPNITFEEITSKPYKCEHSVSSELDLFKSKYNNVKGILKYPEAIPAQMSLSFCLWVYIANADDGFWGLRYLNPEKDTLDLYISDDYVSVEFHDKEVLKVKNLPLSKAPWTHLCVTWSQTEGDTRLFVNGELKDNKTGVWKARKLPAGFIELKQLREVNYDTDDPTKGFVGKLTDVNWWDRVLTHDEVAKVFLCQTALPGNIINPINSTYRLCYEEKPWKLRSGLDNPDDATNELKQISGKVKNPLPETSEFTVCFYLQIRFNYHLKIIARDNSSKNEEPPTFLVDVRGKKVWMSIDGNLKETPLVTNYYSQEFCVTWSGKNGEIKYYEDGYLVSSETGFAAQYTIPSGYLTLSQILNHPVTDEELNDKFKFPLRISEFSWWNRVLSPIEILKTANCVNSLVDGAVINGPNITFEEITHKPYKKE